MKKQLSVDELAALIELKGSPKKCGRPAEYCHYNHVVKIVRKLSKKPKFKDLRPYHFYRVAGIWKDGDWINHKLAREATREWIDCYAKHYKVPIEQVIQEVTQNKLQNFKIKYGSNIGGMVAIIYSGSPVQAMTEALQSHPDSNIRKKFKDLKQYHFKYPPKKTWHLKEGPNYELAREATREWIDCYLNEHNLILDDLIGSVTQKEFKKQKIGFNGDLAGMLNEVYHGCVGAALIDCLQNHPNKSIKSKYRDLKLHHFPYSVEWKSGGVKNYDKGREVMLEFIEVQKNQHGRTIDDLIKNVPRVEDAFIKFNTPIFGMVLRLYRSSVSAALTDCLKHHPDVKIRKKYKNIETLHFGNTTTGFWKEHGSFDSPTFRNVVSELFETLMNRYQWSYSDLIKNIRVNHLLQEKHKYGHSFVGILKHTDNSLFDLIKGYFKHHRLKKVRQMGKQIKPYHLCKATLNVWHSEKGELDMKLVYEALNEWVEIIMKKNSWSYDDLIEKTMGSHINKAIKFDVSIRRMFEIVFDKSVSKALLYYFENHNSIKVREKYSYLKVFHFGVNTHCMWVDQMGNKNHELGAQATGALLQALQEKNGWTKVEALKKIRTKDFYEVPIKHGRMLTSMMQSIYRNNLTNALEDYRKSLK